MSRRVAQFTAALMLSLLAVACQPAAPAGLSDADKAAIKQVADSALAVQAAGDIAGYVTTYYAADGMVLPNEAGPLTGHAEMQPYFQAFPPLRNYTLTQDEVDGLGGLAYVRGTFAFELMMPDSTWVPVSGKYLEVWKKQADGNWKVFRDMWNSNEPPAPPAGK